MRLVRAPNCPFTSVFESPRPKGRAALCRSPPAPHQAKSRTAVETKGQPWQEPVAGSRGANPGRNCQCAPPEDGLSLETSSAALWADRPYVGDFLTVPAPPCLDGAKTDQSTRFELFRCLGNKSGLVRLVRAPHCRFTSVFESPRPNGRVALVRFPPAPHQAKSRTTVETKGQLWQDPVAGSRGANRPRNCQCARPEGGLSLETS